jgi:hypothetical protein
MISDVFDRLAAGCSVSVEDLWRSIDQVIARTLVAANDSITERVRGLDEGRGTMPYPRYFQLIGFDILLDMQFKPWLMEVNYRPSLEFGTAAEKELKVSLLKAVISIGAPFQAIECFLMEKRSHVHPLALKNWIEKGGILDRIAQLQQTAVSESQFEKVLGPESWAHFVAQLSPPRRHRSGSQKAVLGPTFGRRAT